MPLLNDSELKSLADVITEAEKSTAGELRLILVRRSSRNSHVFPLLAFVFATAGLVYLWFARHTLMLGDTTWILPAVLFGAFALAFLLSRWPLLQRRLTWPADLEHQVNQRAELEFHREGLGGTRGGTGILIFLSVFEHQCVVLADKGIASKLDNKVWDEVVADVILGVRSGDLRAQLEKAIRRCGGLLREHFPIQAGDKNEIENHVLVKD